MDSSDERSIIYMPDRGGRGPQTLIQAYVDPARADEADGPIPASQGALSTDESLMGDSAPEIAAVYAESIPVRYLPLDAVRYSQMQIREVDDATLADLARSIQERGVIQPVLVRPLEGGQFELIAGERRLRAARLAGLDVVPALVTDVSDQDSLELAIIENAQREDLNAIEEAMAYRRLIDEFGLSQADVAQAIGKNRATISNALRLLQLPEEIIELLKSNALSAGHGRALLMAKDELTQIRLAHSAVKNGLSVRAIERAVQSSEEGSDGADPEDNREREAFERIETKLSDLLAVERVRVKRDAHGRRTLAITFETEAAWKRFMSRMRD